MADLRSEAVVATEPEDEGTETATETATERALVFVDEVPVWVKSKKDSLTWNMPQGSAAYSTWTCARKPPIGQLSIDRDGGIVGTSTSAQSERKLKRVSRLPPLPPSSDADKSSQSHPKIIPKSS